MSKAIILDEPIIRESLEFANSFDYDEYGLITNPGKFERECRYTPYYWNLAMNGFEDDIVQHQEDSTVYSIFYVSHIEKELFEITDNQITVWSDDQGFVYSNLGTI